VTRFGHERTSISRRKTSKPKPITPTTRPNGKISVCFKIYGKPKYSILADSKYFLIDLIWMEHKINKQLAFWSMLKIIIGYKIEIHGLCRLSTQAS
jgi:hypothetical protein